VKRRTCPRSIDGDQSLNVALFPRCRSPGQKVRGIETAHAVCKKYDSTATVEVPRVFHESSQLNEVERLRVRRVAEVVRSSAYAHTSLVPVHHQPCYTEHIVYLPCCMVVRVGRYQTQIYIKLTPYGTTALGEYFRAAGERVHDLSSSFVSHCHCT